MKTNRRTYLRALAGVGAGVGLTGCGGLFRSGTETERSPTGTPSTERTRTDAPEGTVTPSTVGTVADEWGFEGVVDLSEAGADPTGAEPIDDVLAEHIGPRSLIYLPKGRYRLTDPVVVQDVERVGVVGDGATVVPEAGNTEPLFWFGSPGAVGSILFSGVGFDYSAPDTGGRPLLARGRESVLIEDLTVEGEADVDEDLVRVDVVDPDGDGMVRRLRMPDGAPPDTRVTACQVGDNRGDLWFVDCEIAGFPDNGLYADPPEGSVHVIGGLYRNNGVAGVRVNANERSVVRGVTVRCDEAEGAGENMRGIWLRGGNSILVEDCVVDLREVTSSDGAVVFSRELGSATVRNCRIRVDADGVNAVRVKSPASAEKISGPFVCEGLSIVGSASRGAAIQAANRTGCTFRNVCLYQPGDSRDGIHAANVTGTIVDSTVAVSGDPFVFDRSSLSRRNVRVARSDDVGGGSYGPCGPAVDLE